MNDRQWQKHISEKLNGYEEPAPDGLWDDIVQSMSQGEKPLAVTPGERRSLVLPLWLRWVSAAAAVVAIAIFAWLATDVDTTQTISPTETSRNNTLNNKPTLSQSAETRREADNASEITHTTTNGPVRSMVAATGTEVTATNVPSDEQRNYPSDDNLDAPSDEKRMVESATKDSIATVADKPKQNAGKMPQYDYRDHQPLPKVAAKPGSTRFAFDLYASNLTGASSISREKVPSLTSQLLAGGYLSQNPSIKSVVELTNSDKNITSKMNHKFPVRAGLSVRYDFSRRFGLSTGLQYSYLSSDFSWGSSESYYTGTQTLHYIGVPVNLICDIWSNGRFSVYASGGMTMEKCIDGRITTDYYLNGSYETRESTEATEKRLQWSANAALGLQVRLVSGLSLYAEPGACYYIDNGSSTDNIYKDKPFNFNFNIGLRWTIR